MVARIEPTLHASPRVDHSVAVAHQIAQQLKFLCRHWDQLLAFAHFGPPLPRRFSSANHTRWIALFADTKNGKHFRNAWNDRFQDRETVPLDLLGRVAHARSTRSK